MTERHVVMAAALELCVLGNEIMHRPIPPMAVQMHALIKLELEGRFIRSIGNGQGGAANQFNFPCGVTVLPDGNVAVCDYHNHRLQIVNPSTGAFIRSIGNGRGAGPNQFCFPIGMVVLTNGDVVVCDSNNHRLQIVNPSAGTFIRSIGNGNGAAANQFDSPFGVAALPDGNVVV